MPSCTARYYLYAESTIDECGVPIQKPLELNEAENVYGAAMICVGEAPDWLKHEVTDLSEGDGWASISFGIDGRDIFLELCNIGFKDIAHL